jgi:addiction module HigA family antidote
MASIRERRAMRAQDRFGPLLGANWTSSIEFANWQNWRFRRAIGSSGYEGTALDNIVSASMSNIVSVFDGRMVMQTKLKSRTTTRRSPRNGKVVVARRLPAKRPPTHPGEMLLEEFLKPLGISQSAFAVRLGISFPRLNEVVRRRRSVTPDTALRLAQVLGVSADFWLGLQQDWDLWHAKRSKEAAAIARLEPLVHAT